MGSEGYLINEFLAAAHQPAHRRLGRRAREPDALPASRSSAAPARRSGADFIIVYRLSHAGPGRGRPTWDEVVALAHGVEAAGATIINTGIGWHEARVPTIVTSVPRGAFAWVTAPADGRGVGFRWSPPTGSTSPTSPRRSWPTATRTWSRWPGRCWPTRTFVRKAAARPRGRDQHLHRLQPGLPGPHLRRQDRLLPGQPARLPRDRAGARADRAAQARRRRRRRARPGWPAPSPRPSAATRVTLFEAADEIGGQFNLARRSPARRSSPRRCATSAASSSCSASTCGSSTPATRPSWPTGGLRRGRARHRRHAAHARDPDGVDHPSVLGYLDVLRDDAPSRRSGWR